MSAGTFAGVAGAAAGDRADEIRLITREYRGTSEAPASASGFCHFHPSGLLTTTGVVIPGITPAVNADEWHRDNPVEPLGDDWEIRATLLGGTTPTTNAGLNTWLRINTQRVWGNSTNVEGLVFSTLTFDFRLFGTTTILKTITGSNVVARQII